MNSSKKGRPRVDLLSIGLACWDSTYLVDDFRLEDDKVRASNMVAGGGGPASNAAVAVARLGFQTAFYGYLGDDAFGAAHLQELRNENVKTELIVRGKQMTSTAVSVVPSSGKRYLISFISKNQEAIGADKIIRFIEDNDVRAILVDGHESNVSLECVAYARKKKIPTILDGGSLHAGTQVLLNQVDYPILSSKFAVQLTGNLNASLSLDELSKEYNFIAVTLADKGVKWYLKGIPHYLPAIEVETKDTNGAGDAFHAGFSVGISNGSSIEASLLFANYYAAATCTRIGARTSFFSAEEFLSFLKAHKAPPESLNMLSINRKD